MGRLLARELFETKRQLEYLSPRGVSVKSPIAAQPHDYRFPRGYHHENPYQEHDSGGSPRKPALFRRSQTRTPSP
jgi:hypothetical protein